MARRRKIPECGCVACKRFNVDGPKLWNDLRGAYERAKTPFEADLYEQLKADLVKGEGCDLCGSSSGTRIAFVPQIIKDFFQIEHLCEWCRDTINRVQREQDWPICWGSTSDDEIKWFLVALVYEQYRLHWSGGEFVMFWDCCVSGCHARRAPVKPEPYKWPEPRWEPAPEIEITIKRRVKPVVIDV